MAGMLGTIRRLLTGSQPRQQFMPRAMRIRAKYDAAQTTAGNRRHWANADYLSADAAASPSVRKILRARTRYEVQNNPYARGIGHTIANYVVGQGPRLQLQYASPEDNQQAERAFARWCAAIRLPQRLRTARIAQFESGECFGLLTSNPRVADLTGVSLDLRLIEADQVCMPVLSTAENRLIDGIRFDDAGNPITYLVLRRHPGDTITIGGPLAVEYDEIPADQVLHLFRSERPGQSRGVPELAAALPTCAQLRRYMLAVLDTAENAARYVMFMSTTMPADGAAEVDMNATIEPEPNEAVFLPEGWTPYQMKAEQPTAEFAATVHQYLSEIGRVCQIPAMIVTGDASNHNFASGRLDYQSFLRWIDVERTDMVAAMLDPLLEAWRREASLVEGLLPQSMRTEAPIPHAWTWPGLEHVDQLKDANAQTARLAAGVSSIQLETARAGLDWEEVQNQQAAALGLTLDDYRARLAAKLLAGASQPAAAPAPEDQP